MKKYPRPVWVAYWWQVTWFYLWKWTRPVSWLHVRTIRPVNEARLSYLDAVHANRRGDGEPR